MKDRMMAGPTVATKAAKTDLWTVVLMVVRMAIRKAALLDALLAVKKDGRMAVMMADLMGYWLVHTTAVQMVAQKEYSTVG